MGFFLGYILRCYYNSIYDDGNIIKVSLDFDTIEKRYRAGKYQMHRRSYAV